MPPVILITGALAGIGRATAIAFARDGASVVLSGRQDEISTELARELDATGAEYVFVKADVRNEKDITILIQQCVERFGHLDVAVNNAGVEGQPGPLTSQTPTTYMQTFETNVLGVLLSMKHELIVMQSQGYGSIINLSSTMGSRGAAGAAIYAASKHAVEGLTKSAAIEAAEYGVRVNAVAPGPIGTDLLSRFTGGKENISKLIPRIPMRRIGAPDDIAQMILFLASKKASYITGQIFGVDGGKMAM